jgi:hypothetical protein
MGEEGLSGATREVERYRAWPNEPVQMPFLQKFSGFGILATRSYAPSLHLPKVHQSKLLFRFLRPSPESCRPSVYAASWCLNMRNPAANVTAIQSITDKRT